MAIDLAQRCIFQTAKGQTFEASKQNDGRDESFVFVFCFFVPVGQYASVTVN